MNNPTQDTKQDLTLTEDLKRILVSEKQLQDRIQELGREITKAYEGEEITVISVINGAILFTADLIRSIDLPLRLDCIRVSSYKNETHPVTEPEIIDSIRLDLAGQRVLLIDDVLDTGKTLAEVVNIIQTLGPADIKTCVLLKKQGKCPVSFHPDFCGFSIPDEFVVGYGLDFAERYRNLPCIGILKPELQNPPEWQ